MYNADDETYVKNSLRNRYTYRKVLGVNWNTTTDKFVFEFNDIINIASKLNVTKRNILKVSAMFFNPLGLICPNLLQPKLLFRNIAMQKCQWVTKVNIDINNKWKLFLSDLKTIKQIETNRHVLCYDILDVDLHGFGDASRVAYGTVVYVRSVCRHGVKVSLWTGKCCAAPVKLTTVPRLELLACVLLSKLIVSVKKTVAGLLNIRNVFCWSDSQTLVWWIRQVRKDCKVWVENRVQVIRKNVVPEYWMYVPTDTNPANVTNRFLSPNAFVSCEIWWKGPDFLHLENIDMPC